MVILVDYLNILDMRDKMKELQRELRQKEMDRIFNEYLRNNYQSRYNVEKNIVLSALIGEQNIEKELSIQDKKERQLNKESIKTKLYTNNYLINKSMLMKKGSMMLKKI
jgi:hypothetical protein